jgi:hypothetical protein
MFIKTAVLAFIILLLTGCSSFRRPAHIILNDEKPPLNIVLKNISENEYEVHIWGEINFPLFANGNVSERFILDNCTLTIDRQSYSRYTKAGEMERINEGGKLDVTEHIRIKSIGSSPKDFITFRVGFQPWLGVMHSTTSGDYYSGYVWYSNESKFDNRIKN